MLGTNPKAEIIEDSAFVLEQADKITDELHRITQGLGFLTVESWLEFKENAIKGLRNYGGSFLSHIAYALKEADFNNAAKIVTVWRSDCEQFAMMWRIAEAKRKALEAEGNENG